MAAPVVLAQRWLLEHRPPLDLSPVEASLRYRPVDVAPPGGPARLAGAWAVEVADRRFGGISGLAEDRGRLLALSDSGLVFSLEVPGTPHPRARVRALPAVAGDPLRKPGRDSEALLADPAGRGWWVAFEHRHALLRFDRDFTRLEQWIELDGDRLRPNRGVEALMPSGRGIRPIPESAGVSDATGLPGGGAAILQRWLGWAGFGGRVRGLGAPIELHLSPHDNPEGIAAAPLANGGTRLWIVTDNDGLPWRRTLLLALDVPAAGRR